MENLYDILGVKPDASHEDIRKAFKLKAKQHHPDREGGDNEKMMQVTVAHRILSNKQKRERYDQTGSANNEPSMEELALRKIEEALNEVFEQGTSYTFEVQDPIKAVMKAAKKGRQEVIRRMKHLLKQRKIVATATHRLVRNAEKVTPIFERFVAAVPRRLEMHHREVQIIELSISILQDVEYETREPTQYDMQRNEEEKLERLEEMQRIMSDDYDPDEDEELKSWDWWKKADDEKPKKKRKKKV